MRTVSVIIPVKEINEFARESARSVRALYPECEILIVPDIDLEEELPGVKVIASWPATAPGEKRDIAARQATGEILAFLDDDAYPGERWLEEALVHFDNEDVAAVGGPGVTPPSNNRRQRASGWILASFLGSGGYTYRFRPGRRRDVDDFPSMNLLARKSDFNAVNGFQSRYWPGEDSEFCRKITSEAGRRIVYEPNSLVYHHRRPVFRGHLRQQARYGLHRGHFARRFSGNSRRISYAVPTLFTLGLVLGFLVAIASNMGMMVYLSVLGIYVVGLAGTAIWVWYLERDLLLAALVAFGIFVTHVTYGTAYAKGLLTKQLDH